MLAISDVVLSSFVLLLFHILPFWYFLHVVPALVVVVNVAVCLLDVFFVFLLLCCGCCSSSGFLFSSPIFLAVFITSFPFFSMFSSSVCFSLWRRLLLDQLEKIARKL